MKNSDSGDIKAESPRISEALNDRVNNSNTFPSTNPANEGAEFMPMPTVAQFENRSNNNELDLDALRLTQNFESLAPSKKVITMVPVRKPAPQQFIRVHQSEEWSLSPVAILEMKEDRENYLVHPSIHAELISEVVTKALFTTINRTGDISLWPIRLPGPDGRIDNWNRSALIAVEEARKAWVRVIPNMTLGIYEVQVATANIPDPEWPTNYSFADLVQTAFRDRIISSSDHPILKQLRGEL